jgi:hypothetical protein
MASQPQRSQVPSTTSRLSTFPSQKPRQLSHLHSQLAQLTAHVSDLENLLRVTAVQAESMRNLGGYAGAMYVNFRAGCNMRLIDFSRFRFMASSKVLGEETVNNAAQTNPSNDGQPQAKT